MRTRTTRHAAIVAAVIAAAVLTMATSCGHGATCAGFAASLAADAHGGQATPLQAAVHYAKDAPGYPDDPAAWTTVTTTADGQSTGGRGTGTSAAPTGTSAAPTGDVTLQAGNAQLHVTRLSDGTWLVNGGRNC